VSFFIVTLSAAEWRYTRCHFAECHYSQCRYPKGSGTLQSTKLLDKLKGSNFSENFRRISITNRGENEPGAYATKLLRP